MNTDALRPSAKIYQFPTRKSGAGPGTSGPSRAPPPRLSQPVPAVEFGSAWYHEAAVQAETTRK
jgi:hypothetical protein